MEGRNSHLELIADMAHERLMGLSILGENHCRRISVEIVVRDVVAQEKLTDLPDSSAEWSVTIAGWLQTCSSRFSIAVPVSAIIVSVAMVRAAFELEYRKEAAATS